VLEDMRDRRIYKSKQCMLVNDIEAEVTCSNSLLKKKKNRKERKKTTEESGLLCRIPGIGVDSIKCACTSSD
jgi:hypothetical protein